MTETAVRRPGSRGPLPTGKGTLIGLRLQPDLLTALDSWITDQSEQRSRPDAIRFALRDWLVGQGRMRAAADDPERAN